MNFLSHTANSPLAIYFTYSNVSFHVTLIHEVEKLQIFCFKSSTHVGAIRVSVESGKQRQFPVARMGGRKQGDAGMRCLGTGDMRRASLRQDDGEVSSAF